MKPPWTPEAVRLQNLDDDGLIDLMTSLFRAHAHRTGTAHSVVNPQSKAADGGRDGSTSAPRDPDRFFPGAACWQFKAGVNGEPARLKGEASNAEPQKELTAGGWYIVVASACGPEGIERRRKVLLDEVGSTPAFHARVMVLGYADLVEWLLLYPKLALRFCGFPRQTGMALWEDWSREREEAEWRERELHDPKQLAESLPLGRQGGLVHLHISGPPGVGKTRLALEIAHEAPWRQLVLYVEDEQRSREPVSSWLAHLSDPGQEEAHLVLVVDECALDEVLTLHRHVRRLRPRVLLVTIGHEAIADDANARTASDQVEVRLSPLTGEEMGSLLALRHPSLRSEQIRYLVRVSEGFVRLGLEMAEALIAHPEVSTPGLLSDRRVAALLEKMFTADQLDALMVFSAMNRVGWHGELAAEARLVAQCLEIPWDGVCRGFTALRQRKLIQVGGDYAYVTPQALAHYAYLQAYQRPGSRLDGLRRQLSPLAQEAFDLRSGAIRTTPFGRTMAQEELRRSFLEPDELQQADVVRRWALNSAADPALAAYRARKALQEASKELKLRVVGTRRTLVHQLVRLTAWKDAFEDSALALAELALAENETWGNNASHEFVMCFDLRLSHSESPWLLRLPVLDALIERPEARLLALRGAMMVVSGSNWNLALSPSSEGPLPVPWRVHPGSPEHWRCMKAGLERVERVALLVGPEQLHKLPEALVHLFRRGYPRDIWICAATLLSTLVQAMPALRPPVEKALRERVGWLVGVGNQIRRSPPEPGSWRDVSEDDRAWIQDLWARWDSETPDQRFRRLAGPGGAKFQEDVSMEEVASQHLASEAELMKHWTWLTSEAQEAWELGRAMARMPIWQDRFEFLLGLPGRGEDGRLLCGFLEGELGTRSEDEQDDYLDALLRERPEEAWLVAEATWRLHRSTTRGALRLADMMEAGQLPLHFGCRLGWGGWTSGPAPEALGRLLHLMAADADLAPALVQLLAFRLDDRPRRELRTEEVEFWRPFAMQLLQATFENQSQDVAHHWEDLAKALLPESAETISRWILDQTSRRSPLEVPNVGFLLSAANAAGDVVWRILAPHLAAPYGFFLTMRLPDYFLQRLPEGPILEWIDEDSEARAPIVLRLLMPPVPLREEAFAPTEFLETVGTDVEPFEADMERGARWLTVLRRHAQFLDVRREATAMWQSGGWTGPWSGFIASRIPMLDALAGRAEEPRPLRDWAHDLAARLRTELEEEKRREAEEAIRYR